MAVVSDTLAGRVVALAGAAGGLGPTVARTLAAAGAALTLSGRDQGALDALAAELGAGAGRVDAHAADLTDLDAARGWAAHAQERLGRVDALVHLVGGWRGGQPIATAPVEDDAWLHRLLVGSVQVATRAFLPALSASGGRFVLVSSVQAQRPTSTNAAYAAAKAAAEAWTLALADELAGHGGTANVVVVDAILTPEMRAAEPDRAFAGLTAAEDIAAAIAFLLGDAGGSMNGQRLGLHG